MRFPHRPAACVAILIVGFLAALAARLYAQDAERATKLAQEAMARVKAGDSSGAMKLAEQAIEADPNSSLGYGIRGYIRFKLGQRLAAIEDYGHGLEINPQDVQVRLWRTQCYMSMDNWRAAAEDADIGFQATHAASFQSLHGWTRINLGEVDEGLAEMDQAAAANPGVPAFLNRFDGYFFKADWKEGYEEFKRAFATGQASPPAYFFGVKALIELGDYETARQTAESCQKFYGKTTEAQLAGAYVYGTAAAKGIYDPDKALSLARNSQSNPPIAHMTNTLARIYIQAERYHDAIEELQLHGRLTNFETLFLLGVANFKIGHRADARHFLVEARRLNPYLARHAERVEALSEFLKGIDKELAVEAKSVDRKTLSQEQATESLAVSELETLVRRFQFGRALAEYKRYAESLKSPVRKREADERIAQLQGLVALFGKLTGKLNSGQMNDLKFKAGGLEATLTKALDDGTFEFKIPKGSGKGTWAGMGIEAMISALERPGPAPEEWLALGTLAFDFGLGEKSFEYLQRGIKADAKLKPRLDEFLAERLGVETPEGGFVGYKGRWVTPEDKTQFDKGLVPYEGAWVSPADREKLARGLQKVDDKWLPRDEAQLVRMGYKKYKDKWYSRDEYQSMRSKWDTAFEASTEHYEIRSNKSDEFAQELAKLIEVTYTECRKIYGGAEPKLPGKEKMTLYAFGTFEDYRKYCVDNKYESNLQAGGFAVSNSNVVVGWDKTNNQQMFLQTMAHEAAHLYYYRIAPSAKPASWFAESMATQLEGFYWDGKAYAYDRISHSRVPFIQQAVAAKKHFTIEQLVGGDALALINSDSEKALVFYAECWALFYYLSHTTDLKNAEAFGKYCENIDKGGQRDLKGFFRDPTKMEEDFLKFVKGL